MRIVIDYMFDHATGAVIGEQVIHTEAPNTIRHPLDSVQTLSLPQFIGLLNTDSELRQMSGWNESSQGPDEDKPLTRWERLLAHTASDDGDPVLKALNLGSTNVNAAKKGSK